jgi:Replication-relaxation
MNQRQEEILLKINQLTILSRQQIAQIFNLGSKRNTNRVLKCIAPYLSSFREGYDTVYYLSKQGREYIGSDRVVKKTIQSKHILMRNQYYIFQGCPEYWKNEMKVTDGGKITVICDALYQKTKNYHIFECDVTQTMKENANKIMKYKQIYDSKEFQNRLGYFPKVHFLTESVYRKEKLMTLLNGLPFQCFTYDEIR